MEGCNDTESVARNMCMHGKERREAAFLLYMFVGNVYDTCSAAAEPSSLDAPAL